jgi:putative tricarboxylic transport membrane protein
MKTLDSASSFFWLLVSLVTLRESYRLGIGSVHNPGTGFLSFWAAAILGILSLVLLLMALLKKEASTRTPLFAGTAWKRVLFVLAVLTIYAVLMPVLGYLISTFMLMLLLFWVLEKKRFGVVFLSAFLTTFVTYLVFSKWLNCQFPEGLFGL